MGKVVSGAAKAVTQGVKAVVQPVYNATLKQIPGVDNALVGLDKAVGKSIPGGWGTVAAVASSFIPGAQLAAMGMTKAGLATGLGALSGSGVMRGKHDFNLQGAIMGGAMAYGAAQLSAGLQEAGNATTKSIEEAAKAETSQIAANLGVEGASTGAGSQAAMLAQQNAGFGAEGLASINSGANQAIQANLANTALQSAAQAAPGAGTDVFSGLAGTQGAVPVSAVPQPSGLANLASGTGSNIADAGAGIKNLAGFGSESGTAAAARSAFTGPVTSGGVSGLLVGSSGLAALEEQQKQLDQQLASGAIGDAEYASAKASIDAQIATANKAVSDNPFSINPDRSFEKQDTLYATPESSSTVYAGNPSASSATLYAVGGSVDDESGMDEARGLATGNMQNGFMGGGIAGYAAGGQPRFLSGGGDGMSDDIPATIEGQQEARLSDSEFVIPADIVSHLGNGSSRAGAKQLYAMMDRVRQARTGTKKQGKEIDASKMLPV